MSTVSIQGKQFRLRPYSPKVVGTLQTEEPKIEERLKAGEIDKFQYYLEVLKLIADGPHDELEYESVDGRQMEETIYSFLPPSERTQRMLLGFLES